MLKALSLLARQPASQPAEPLQGAGKPLGQRQIARASAGIAGNILCLTIGRALHLKEFAR